MKDRVKAAEKRADRILKMVTNLEADMEKLSADLGTDDETGTRVYLALGSMRKAADGLNTAGYDLSVGWHAAIAKEREEES